MRPINFFRLPVFMLISISISTTAVAQFSGGGTGTEQNPYQIVTAADLNKVRDYTGAANAGKYFRLMNEIDLTVFLTGNAEGWLPIGDEANPFSGHFDGAGHKIEGLRINRTGTYAGLFGYSSGTISNLGVNGEIAVLSPTTVPVTGVTVSPSTLSKQVGDTDFTLTATVSPSNASDKTVTWESGNTSVATVNSTTGLIHIVAAGTARVTATTTDGGFTDYCDVTVTSGGGGDGTYNVATAGTLATLVGETNKKTLTSIVLTGSLNGDDIAFIRKMAMDFKLTSLNMSGAAIVTGGGAYNTGPYTANNVIGPYMFANLRQLKTLELPLGVTSIEENAIASCSGLTSLTIPNGVTSIGKSAFSYCRGLTSITIPNNVTSIGKDAFLYCSQLTELHVKCATPPTLDGSPLVLTPDTKKLYVPSGTKSAYQSSAWGSYFTAANIIEEPSSGGTDPVTVAVTGVTVNQSTLSKQVGDTDFTLTATVSPSNASDKTVTWESNESSVATVNRTTGLIHIVAAGTARITATTTDGEFTDYCDITVTAGGGGGGGDGTTYNVSGGNLSTLVGETNKKTLTSLTLTGNLNGDDIAFIRKMAMDFKLTSLNMSGAAIVAGGDAYVDDRHTTNNVISPYMFVNLRQLKTLVLPSGVTSIEQNAIASCSGLTSLTIPNGVTSIGKSAFSYCRGLTSITLPNNVTSIGKDAFLYCSQLTELHVKCATPPTLDDSPLVFTPDTKKLYVPSGTKSAYQSSAWGSYFTAANIIEESSFTGINHPESLAVSVYPNPAGNDLFIQSGFPIERVELYSSTGVLVKFETNVTEKIDVSPLTEGIYFVRIYSGNQVIVHRVVVKN